MAEGSRGHPVRLGLRDPPRPRCMRSAQGPRQSASVSVPWVTLAPAAVIGGGTLDCVNILRDAASVTVSVRNGAISTGKGTPMSADITTRTARQSAVVAPTTQNGPRAAWKRQALDAAQTDERTPTSLLISARQALERG